jgi:hypothetical protein
VFDIVIVFEVIVYKNRFEKNTLLAFQIYIYICLVKTIMRCIFAYKINEKHVNLTSTKPRFENNYMKGPKQKSGSYLANYTVFFSMVWQKPKAITIPNDLIVHRSHCLI